MEATVARSILVSGSPLLVPHVASIWATVTASFMCLSCKFWGGQWQGWCQLAESFGRWTTYLVGQCLCSGRCFLVGLNMWYKNLQSSTKCLYLYLPDSAPDILISYLSYSFHTPDSSPDLCLLSKNLCIFSLLGCLLYKVDGWSHCLQLCPLGRFLLINVSQVYCLLKDEMRYAKNFQFIWKFADSNWPLPNQKWLGVFCHQELRERLRSEAEAEQGSYWLPIA